MNNMTNYSFSKYRNKFIDEAKFAVPLDYYLELTENQRIAMYLKTKLILDQMKDIESSTILFKKDISEKTANALAQSVLAICDAMNEHMAKKAGSKVSINESFVQELKDSEEYNEFKAFRFITLEKEETLEESDELPEHLNETIKLVNDVKKNCSYPEREIIFEYLLNMWKTAAKNKNVNEGVNEGVNEVSQNQWSSQDMIDAKNRKAAFAKTQKDRMAAYIGHLKNKPYTMT